MNTIHTTVVKQSDIFISWNSKDRIFKNQIVEYLKNKYNIWESDNETAGNIRDCCIENIKLSKIFILVLTENSISSEWVLAESIYALENYENYQNRIIVVSQSQEILDNFSDILLKTKQTNKILKELSGVIINNYININELLGKILYNVELLMIAQSFYEFKKNQFFNSIPIPLLKRDVNIVEVSSAMYDDVYINREIIVKLSKGKTEKINDWDVINQSGISVLSGEGGVGKTQYLRHLVNIYAQSKSEKLLFYAEFTELNNYFKNNIDKDMSFKKILYYIYKSRVQVKDYNEKHFNALLESKKDNIILIIDGADEVEFNELININERLSHFCDQYRNTRIIISTRKMGNKSLFSFNGIIPSEYILSKLTENDKKKLIHKIFLCLGNNDGEEEFYISLNDINEELVNNPLLLTQMAVIYKKSGSVPKTIYEIYNKAAKLLIDELDNKKKIKTNFSGSTVLSYLSYVAYERFINPNVKYVNLLAREINKDIKNKKAALEKAEELMEYFDQRALIVNDNFTHKMFLEFFTAMKIYDDIFIFDELSNKKLLIQYIKKYYKDSLWENVIKILVSKIIVECDEKNSIKSLKIIIDNTNQDYHLLCEAIPQKISNGIIALRQIVRNIFKNIFSKKEHPYNKLFVYVPIYNMYETLSSYILEIRNKQDKLIALSLLRDMSVMYEGVNTFSKLAKKFNFSNKSIVSEYSKLSFETTHRGVLNSLFYNETLSKDIRLHLENMNIDETFPEIFNISNYYYEYMLDRIPDIKYNYIAHTKHFIDELKLINTDNLTGGLLITKNNHLLKEYIENTDNVQEITGIYLTGGNNNLKFLPNYLPSLSILITNPEVCQLDDFICAYLGENTQKFSLFINDNIKILNNCTKLHLSYDLLEIYLYGNIERLESTFIDQEVVQKIRIPNAITELEDTFSGCINLQNITIPNNVKKIGFSVFSNCKSLGKIIIPMNVEEIGYEAFSGCSALKEVELPNDLSEIDSYAFMDCKNLIDIVIPENIKKINDGTFYGCSNLRKIRFPEYMFEIGDLAFYNCMHLTDVTIPEMVRQIGEKAFYACENLKRISIPDGVQIIKKEAFSKCIKLEDIQLPETLEEISEGLFSGCVGIKQIIIPFFNSTRYTFYGMPVIKRSFSRKIGDNSFYGCSSLEYITIPKSINIIGEKAFFGCISLKKIVIPYSVNKIKGNVFENCSNLENVFFEDDDIAIDETAFLGCTKLDQISQEFINNHLVKNAEDDEKEKLISLNTENNRRDRKFLDKKSIKEVKIESDCKKIVNLFFENFVNLKKVYIPESVIKIGIFAFSGCSSLENITIPDSVKEIEDGVFNDCCSLTNINLSNNIKKISMWLFSGCSSLENITIPNSVERIGWSAFSGCTKLTNINIPNSVKDISMSAFSDCTNLENITLPDELEEISIKLFEGCTKLDEVNLPYRVKMIGDYAFSGCNSLKKINIPNSVIKIGQRAFKDCESLVNIKLPESITTLEDGLFENCISLKEIVIPSQVENIASNAFLGCKLHKVTLPRHLLGIAKNIFKKYEIENEYDNNISLKIK